MHSLVPYPMIALITTCDPERLYLLPEFVRHYRGYGVGRFFINLHFDVGYATETHEGHLSRANALLASVGESIHSTYSGLFTSAAIRDHHDGIQREICESFPWIVAADSDEFHEFPDALPALARFMDRHGLDYVLGRFVDRMARVGFPAFQADLPIWQQFPLGTDMTRAILRGDVEKIMLHRSSLRIRRANHGLLPGTTAKLMPGDYAVHHFKWDSSVVPRLRRRLQDDWKAQCGWWMQSQRGADWIDNVDAVLGLAGVRVFDFRDDEQADGGGPLSANPVYRRSTIAGEGAAGAIE